MDRKMTFQTPELFIYKGDVHYSQNEPLESFLEENPVDWMSITGCLSSACWRGYIGTWHIVGDRIFLIALADSTRSEEIDLSVIFPQCEARVFAHWFTGVLQLPFGEEVTPPKFEMIDPKDYVGYYQLEFKRGHLVSALEVYNEFPSKPD
jgi:hypothetical protein